jgi:cytochrome c oxidase subunit 2
VIGAVDTAKQYDDVARLYLPVAVAVFVLFAGLIVLLAWRGRRRAQGSQREENNLLELGYVGVLAAIIVVLVVTTFRADDRITAPADARAGVPVDVVAAKWRWRFSYPGRGVVVAAGDRRVPTLVVPVGTPIRFSATSLDVVHGFWVPSMRFQRELFPDKTTTFTLTFPKVTLLSNQPCSFFCGLGHTDMKFAVDVVGRSEFDAWVRSRGGAP